MKFYRISENCFKVIWGVGGMNEAGHEEPLKWVGAHRVSLSWSLNLCAFEMFHNKIHG